MKSNVPPDHAADEYYVNHPTLLTFIEAVQRERSRHRTPATLVTALKPAFGALLADHRWLPPEFARPFTGSGMGGGIGQYLLFRAADRSLSLFSLVVPAGISTPVHDHLSWGLVGLYSGEQYEEVYEPGSSHGTPELRLTQTEHLTTGQFYPLLPPTNDVHRVTTTSQQPSISIHLLGNDTGCAIRHRFDPDTGSVENFRSGWSNVPCPPHVVPDTELPSRNPRATQTGGQIG
ncbi:MAG: hypothetical protein NVS4B8_26410 [Herpetosiphon sp.]